MRLHERQDLPDDSARGGAVVRDVEGVRPGRVIDEGHRPIVADGLRFTAPGNPETKMTAGVLSDAVRSGG
jgi:hypothetical protein